jgi:PAS domain S-box-containing protein
MEFASLLLTVLEVIIALVTLFGVIVSIWKFLVRPIKDILALQKTLTTEIQGIKKTNEESVLPMINSFYREFSSNGGKSIKDQITRIDDNTRLSELRSKLVATTLLTTGSFECSPDGLLTWGNKALCDLLGLSYDELLGKGWLSAVDEEERADVWFQWMENVENGIPHESIFTVNNQKTGESFLCRSNAFTHKTIDGRILGYYGTIIRLPNQPSSLSYPYIKIQYDYL